VGRNGTKKKTMAGKWRDELRSKSAFVGETGRGERGNCQEALKIGTSNRPRKLCWNIMTDFLL
jgi:hypothetical protein